MDSKGLTLDCPQTQDSSKIYLGIFIITGLLVSYLPQFWKIMSQKSSLGISIWFLTLGFIGASSTIANVILLQSNSISCCYTQWPLWYCIQDTLAISQMTVQFCCFSFLVVLFFYFLPGPMETSLSLFSSFMALYFLVVTLAVSFVLSLDSTIYNVKYSLAGALGIVSALSGTVQYLPQVIFTFLQKDFGALSVETLLMQCPGSFLFVYSLILQPGINWTSWISFAICGTFQGILIIMYVWFRYLSAGYQPIPQQEEEEDLEQATGNDTEDEPTSSLPPPIPVIEQNTPSKLQPPLD